MIYDDVKNSLLGSHYEIMDVRDDLAKVSQTIERGDRTPERMAERDALEARIMSMKDDAIDTALNVIDDWIQEAEAPDRVDADELDEATADVELLKSGLPLTANDLGYIVQKHRGNNSVATLVRRTAAERGIELSGFDDYLQSVQEAKNLRGAAAYWRRYLGEPGGDATLRRMFEP